MRQWQLIIHIYALLSLSMEARSTDVADIELGDPNVKSTDRAGRSSPDFTAQEDLENSHYTSYQTETSKPDDFLRSLRGRDNFIRFGRARNDNFMRFGRGKQDNVMRFGRNAKEKETEEYDRTTRSAKGNKKSGSDKFERLTKNFIRLGRGAQDNFMRFGRGKQDNFMRFGRGKQDNFMRFGRGKQENFMRFGRGKQENFMRFGRGKQENFMRFGRGKQDNFIRLGRGKQDNFMRFGRGKQEKFMRFGRGKEDNFMRFRGGLENLDLHSIKQKLDFNDLLRDTRGKHYDLGRYFISSSDDSQPIAMRSLPADYGSFARSTRSRQDNFMRFGKSESVQQSPQPLDLSEDLKHNPSFNTDSTIPLIRDTFPRVLKSRLNNDISLLRQGRRPPNKDDSFIRFGRNSQGSVSSTSLIPQRRKRSTFEIPEGQEDMLPSEEYEGISDRILLPVLSLTDYRDAEHIPSPEQLEDYNSRRKRSVKIKPLQSSLIGDRILSLDGVSSQLLDNSEELSDLFDFPLFLTPTSSSFNTEE